MLQNLKDVTKLLHQWRDGSPTAENELFDLVFPDLRRLAHYLMRGERKDHSMQATELVDQIYLRLVAAKNQDWQNRRHFYAIAARAMRRYLIDHARGRADAEFLPIDEMENFLPADRGKIDTAVTIDRLLTELAKTQPEWCNLVELKYFLGLTDEEAADVLGMKVRTMQRMWKDARLWLHEHMEPAAPLASAVNLALSETANTAKVNTTKVNTTETAAKLIANTPAVNTPAVNKLAVNKLAANKPAAENRHGRQRATSV